VNIVGLLNCDKIDAACAGSLIVTAVAAFLDLVGVWLPAVNLLFGILFVLVGIRNKLTTTKKTKLEIKIMTRKEEERLLRVKSGHHQNRADD